MPERASRPRAAAAAPATRAAPAHEPDLGLLPELARRGPAPASRLAVADLSVAGDGGGGAVLHLTLEREAADQPLAGLEGRLRVRGGKPLAHSAFRILAVHGRECAVTIEIRDGLAAEILHHFADGTLEAELAPRGRSG